MSYNIGDICKCLEGRHYILFLSVTPRPSTVSGICIDTRKTLINEIRGTIFYIIVPIKRLIQLYLDFISTVS